MSLKNVEEFLIEFKFADKDVVSGLRSFLKEYRKFNKDSVSAVNKERGARKQVNQELKKTNDLLKQKQRQQSANKKQIERDHAAAIRMQNQSRAFQRSAAFRTVQARDPQTAGTYQKRFNAAIRRGDVNTAKDYQVALRGIAREMTKVQRKTLSLRTAQQGLNDSTRNMIRQYASLFAIFAGASMVNKVGQDFESMNAAMLLSAGNANLAAEDMKFVNTEAKRLGLNLKDATDGFIKFQFAATGKMSRNETKELFTGFSEFATALGVDKFRYEKGLTSLQQMMNKGQIMSEELKQQLAEQIPGALKAFEAALGVSTAELFRMMERGELMAADVLPKVGKEFARLARQGGALEQKLKSTRVAQGQLNVAMQESADLVFKSGFADGLSELLRGLTGNLEDLQDGAMGLGKFFKLIFRAIKQAADILTPILDSVGHSLGSIAEVIDTALGQYSGGALLGITALTAAAFKLNGAFKVVFRTVVALIARLVALPLLAIAGIDEIISNFDPNRMSAFEKHVLGGKQTNEFSGFKYVNAAVMNSPLPVAYRAIKGQNLRYDMAAASKQAEASVRGGETNVTIYVDGVQTTVENAMKLNHYKAMVPD